MSPLNSFNKVQTIWKKTPEYYLNPWQYYVEFIAILKSRKVRFLTMSHAIAGDYNENEINIILDHHIDFYPIETEVMCRWELENRVISNVYLFNHFEVADSPQIKSWKVEDLNIEFYQELEKNGFEIGYHQNAVGQVRNATFGRRYDANITKEEIEKAKSIFAYDVNNLKKYFNIRTFIPHGAGEANAYLSELPEGYEWLTWVYNNAPKQRPINWVNYTDSCGQKTQRIRAPYAQYLLHIDNLHVKAYLAEPGLNHILIHPGRFAKGMPYNKYYKKEKDKLINLENNVNYKASVENDIVYRFEFRFQSEIETLPTTSTKLIADWEGEKGAECRLSHWQSRPDFYPISEIIPKYRILSDDIEVLRNHMASNDFCIPFLLIHDKLDAGKKQALKESHKKKNGKSIPVSCPVPPIPTLHENQKQINELFCEDFFAYYNSIYTHEPLLHLLEIDLRFEYLHFVNLELNKHRNLNELLNVLQKYIDCNLKLFVRVTCDNLEKWINIVEENSAKSVLNHYQVCYDTSVSNIFQFKMHICSSNK